MAATVDIALAAAQTPGRSGGTMPVVDAVPVDTDVIVSSDSSQVTDFAVPDGATGLFWIVTPVGDNIRIKFGAGTPVAAAAEAGGWLVLDGTTREFAAVSGHKGAVITAEV